jgi:pyridoxal phosphate enzyme (YggS family)
VVAARGFALREEFGIGTALTLHPPSLLSFGMMSYPHVAANLAEVKARIAAQAKAWQRAREEVHLVAVGKTHPAEAIEAALLAGHRLFGENRVQEAAAKFPALRARHPDLKLHLIGPLQTNKIRQAIETCDAIETLDRDKLAQGLAAELVKSGRHIDLFVQVNTGEEDQKAGILPREADDFIRRCRDEYKLPIVGLMCIPPADEHPAPHFALLGEIAKRHGLTQLSMGMSGDYELAIQLGATHVRVGTAIFGARETATG